MKYNMKSIMTKAHSIRREWNMTMSAALRLAWGEAKGVKLYTFNLEAERAAVSAYVIKLGKAIKAGLDDIHQIHKYEILRDALLAPVDAHGIAVVEGKVCGLLKYAVRNAA